MISCAMLFLKMPVYHCTTAYYFNVLTVSLMHVEMGVLQQASVVVVAVVDIVVVALIIIIIMIYLFIY